MSEGIIQPGTPAPPFVLKDENGESFTNESITGHTAVFVLFPFAFSPVCTDQFQVYEEVLGEFEAQGATLYGVSCDATYSQTAFKAQLGIEIEQLSDFEPKGAACAAFGVLHPGGFPQRALVVIGPDGNVRWSHEAENPGVLPGANLIFDGLSQTV